jgi:hypothetical protein
MERPPLLAVVHDQLIYLLAGAACWQGRRSQGRGSLPVWSGWRCDRVEATGRQ